MLFMICHFNSGIIHSSLFLTNNTLQRTFSAFFIFKFTEKQKNAFLYIPMQYIQKGFYYTYQGLLHGYLQADPTLTVEMVELVLSFPPECFVHQGVERRMIRDYMKELIPAPILSEKKGQGIQAADFAYCVNRDWDTLKASVYDILEEPLLREYLEEEKLKWEAMYELELY